MTNQGAAPTKRADATRNRLRILEVAREAIDEPGADPSMAEIARRADVGMATLYRNFPSKLDLISELYRKHIDEICLAAQQAQDAEDPGTAFFGWLEQFHAAGSRKGALASLLLADADGGTPVVSASRARVIAAGEPLYAAAQRSGAVSKSLPLKQVLDAIVAVGQIADDPAHPGELVQLVLDGLRCSKPTGQTAV